MTRTNIDLDDEAVERVMAQYGFTTKRDAVNFALRRAAVTPATIEQALALQGSGWDGDLDEMRAMRTYTD